jgi:hypothetical protein
VTAEVTIGGPELTNAVEETQGSDPGVMDRGSGHLATDAKLFEDVEVAWSLVEEDDARRGEPGMDLSHGLGPWCGRSVDPRVRHDGEELVHTRPGHGPRSLRLGEVVEERGRGGVKRGVRPMGINQQVGVDGDQPPRPS